MRRRVLRATGFTLVEWLVVLAGVALTTESSLPNEG